ncbi:MAG: phytanoyl-CoA dioxygenase [Burkholderiales bacterium RIFCSPLOWO2_02_FULL_57_36]|nr:MAG: phytanoyl-CoA dioxygenase [Burkholderiales bacterium RIFCSPLOWO2_02_FULL_57_36]
MATTLSEKQIEQFRTGGYLVLRDMAGAAMCEAMLSTAQSHLRAAVPPLEYEADVGYPGAPQSVDAPGGQTIRRLRGVFHREASFEAWAQHPSLVAKLAQLFGEDVCLSLAHHNCVMTKHPDFGTATGWHRDIRYWSFTRPDLISVWLALGPENAANGALRFIPGSHRMAIAQAQLDELDFLRPDLPQNQALFKQGISLELKRGDVVFFHSGLFHAASRNTTASVKMSLVYAYHGKTNRPVEGTKSAAAGEILLGS